MVVAQNRPCEVGLRLTMSHMTDISLRWTHPHIPVHFMCLSHRKTSIRRTTMRRTSPIDGHFLLSRWVTLLSKTDNADWQCLLDHLWPQSGVDIVLLVGWQFLLEPQTPGILDILEYLFKVIAEKCAVFTYFENRKNKENYDHQMIIFETPKIHD